MSEIKHTAFDEEAYVSISITECDGETSVEVTDHKTDYEIEFDLDLFKTLLESMGYEMKPMTQKEYLAPSLSTWTTDSHGDIYYIDGTLRKCTAPMTHNAEYYGLKS